MSSILIHAWVVFKKNDQYYLPYSHWVYLCEIVKYYDEVILLSPTLSSDCLDVENIYLGIGCFSVVSVYELPGASSYLGSVKHFFSYLLAYKKYSDVDVSYVRVPAPFGWLQRFYIRKKRIIHYVGDSIDTVLKNQRFSLFKKLFYIGFYYPEFLMTVWASRRGARVFCNGVHLSRKLVGMGVNAKALVSSTLKDNDFHIDKEKTISCFAPRLIYVGYLRKAKGIDTVLNAFRLLQKNIPGASLIIVGAGEEESRLKSMVLDNGVKSVVFLGHIDSREKLNSILRESDIFCFASVSEGSPRVVLEAMANGLNVVSTPVGSLPTTFCSEKDIEFFDFNDSVGLCEKIIQLVNDPLRAYSMRISAYEKVSSMTIESFIKEIFHEV